MPPNNNAAPPFRARASFGVPGFQSCTMDGALPPDVLEAYRESAGGQLKLLATLADRLAVSGSDLKALAELNREVHKIFGTAGSYGYRSASRLAAGMEETVKDWRARPHDNESDRTHVVR